MTIAIAIKANDGIVVAADTQESYGGYGSIKSTQSKVKVYEGYGSDGRVEGVCAISGAGEAGFIDPLSDRLGALFSRNAADDCAMLLPKLEVCVRKFHAKHVIPVASTYPSHERPGVEMLMAVQNRKNPPESEIFHATSLGTVHTVLRFAAIGSGVAYAKALLDQYRTLDQSSRTAPLAAYVVLRTKEMVEGCGMHTTVTTLYGAASIRASDGPGPQRFNFPTEWYSEMPWDDLDDLEHYFRRKYAQAERRFLLSAIDRWFKRSVTRQKRRQAK